MTGTGVDLRKNGCGGSLAPLVIVGGAGPTLRPFQLEECSNKREAQALPRVPSTFRIFSRFALILYQHFSLRPLPVWVYKYFLAWVRDQGPFPKDLESRMQEGRPEQSGVADSKERLRHSRGCLRSSHTLTGQNSPVLRSQTTPGPARSAVTSESPSLSPGDRLVGNRSLGRLGAEEGLGRRPHD